MRYHGFMMLVRTGVLRGLGGRGRRRGPRPRRAWAASGDGLVPSPTAHFVTFNWHSVSRMQDRSPKYV